MSASRTPVYLCVYPTIRFSSESGGVVNVVCGQEIHVSDFRSFRPRAEITKDLKPGTITGQPFFLEPHVLQIPNARDWYPLQDLPVCRQCYVYLATRSCCLDAAHKTLCSECSATKCDICGATAPAVEAEKK
jgi:hypothetical protein